MSARGRTGHHNGGRRSTVTLDDLLARREEAYKLPLGPERTKALRRIGGRIRNLECRSERVC